jgi:tetratricopeptide (TPR) repeat protein
LTMIGSMIENSVVDSIRFHYNDIIKKIITKKLKEKNLSKKEKNKYYYCLAMSYTNNARELSPKTDGKLMIAYLDKAISIFKSIEDDENYWSVVNNKGFVLRKMNDFEGAIACFFSALKHQESIGYSFGVANSNGAIGLIYSDQEKHQKAILYYKKALTYFESLKNATPSDLNQITMLNFNIGGNYMKLEKLEIAEKYIYKSITANPTSDNSFQYKKLGDLDIKQKKYNEAIKKYNLGLMCAKNERAKAFLYSGLGQVYFEMNNYNLSKKFTTQAKELAESIGDLHTMEDNYKNLYLINKKNEDYKVSLEMLELYHSTKDTNNTESSRNAVEQQQLKYDFEKKELNYKLDNQKKTAAKNNLLIVLSSLLLLLLFGGYFYYRNNKQKQSIAVFEKNQIKQKLLVTQMNPHFIFNSIDNIQSLIYNKQDTDAVNYLTKFSKLTRQILENSNENYISLAEELTMTENYLAIQQLLYNNKFDFKINVDDSIDTETILLPPMLTQPFIENAIKHGLNNKLENGMINISFFLKESKLFFEVSDNGSGFDANRKTDNHKSLAMTITKERLINYTKNQNFVVQTNNITDKDQNVIGAKIQFEIPYIYEN